MAKHRASGEGSIRKRADNRWEARYYDPRESDPKKQRKSIINKSQKVVVEKLKKVMAEISSGEPIISQDNPTISEWLELWMKNYKFAELRDGTYESYEGHIKTKIEPIIGGIRVKQLTGLKIQNMYNKLLDRKENGGYGLSAATVIKIKNILSGALKQAVVNNIIRNNPLDETNPPKVENSQIRVLSKEEQKQFISVLPFFKTGNMFAVSLATGLRLGELCALDVKDINREEKYININKSAGRSKDKHTGEVSIKIGLPKTNNSIRKIPLLPSVEVILDRQAQLVEEMKEKAGDIWKENTLVFPTEKGNVRDASGMRSSLARILKRAGLPHITIHALRHTYATTALNAGVAAQNVARMLGHKDGATTLRFYAHYINTEAITQLENLEKQNISHLGITANELEKIMKGTSESLQKSNVSDTINTAISKYKNLPPKKSVEMMLSVCEDILCQPLGSLSPSDRELILSVLAQYTMMKRRYTEQERKTKNSKEKER